MVVVIRYRLRCPGLISLFLVCRPRVFKGGECISWHPTAAPGVAGVIYHEGGNSPWYTSYGTEIIHFEEEYNRLAWPLCVFLADLLLQTPLKVLVIH